MKRAFILILAIINFGSVFSCGWDYDTIAMEKQQFPSIHELITGKFLRHSPELYYWRILDREEDIKIDPDSLELYDDLAWAYDKVGMHEKAIATMEKKDAISPGIYETHANLGTSYIHNGQLEKGLKHIKKAIEINPEAHFGREVYQQYLVEYILKKGSRDSLGGLVLPLGTEKDNFYHFLRDRHIDSVIANGSTREDEIAKAVKGIAGMMRFGNYDSPVLLEALGDLLSEASVGKYGGAGHLASRAYLKASYEVEGDASKKYFNKAGQAIERFFAFRPVPAEDEVSDRHTEVAHRYMTISKLDKALKNEIEAAHAWYDTIRQQEIGWIKDGLNPDSAFTANYYDEPVQEVVGENPYALQLSEPDEAFWLSKQTRNPSSIRSIYHGMKLPDSTKTMLDSIYATEFSHYTPPPDEPSISDPPPLPGEQTDEDPYTGVFMIIMGVGALIALILILRIVLPGRKRR